MGGWVGVRVCWGVWMCGVSGCLGGGVWGGGVWVGGGFEVGVGGE